MIVLDTNVLSELLKREPDARVRSWINLQGKRSLYISSITVAEMAFGVATLPGGKRKTLLENAVAAILGKFEGHTLPFDANAALHYAELALTARQAGLGFPTPDGYIAAIAAAKGFSVASRDTAPYEAAGLDVIDPWRAG